MARWNGGDNDDDWLMRAVKEGGHDSKPFSVRLLSVAFDHSSTPSGLHVIVELPLADIIDPSLIIFFSNFGVTTHSLHQLFGLG